MWDFQSSDAEHVMKKKKKNHWTGTERPNDHLLPPTTLSAQTRTVYKH